MKTIYSTPQIEIVPVALESGACIATSGTENFGYTDGTWD